MKNCSFFVAEKIKEIEKEIEKTDDYNTRKSFIDLIKQYDTEVLYHCTNCASFTTCYSYEFIAHIITRPQFD